MYKYVCLPFSSSAAFSAAKERRCTRAEYETELPRLMMDREERWESSDSESLLDGFWESLPLLIVAILLLVVGAIAWFFKVTVGPAGFPLGVILVTLGFVAGIGATLSWFFAGSPRRVRPVTRDWDGYTSRREAARATGRPTPDVRVIPPVATAPKPKPPELWDEGPPEPTHTRPSSPTATASNLETQALIDELERMSRDLAPSRSRVAPQPPATRKRPMESEQR